jgi:hypothetical protein
MLSEKEINAVMHVLNKAIFSLREIRKVISEDKTGLNTEYAIAETYIQQGRLMAMNDYLTKRIALEVGADVKQRISVKELEKASKAALLG